MTPEEKIEQFNYLVQKAYHKYLLRWFLSKEDTVFFEFMEAISDDIGNSIKAYCQGDKIKAKSFKRLLKKTAPSLAPDDAFLTRPQFIEKKLTDDSGYPYARIDDYLDNTDCEQFEKLTRTLCGHNDSCGFWCCGHCMAPAEVFCFDKSHRVDENEVNG